MWQLFIVTFLIGEKSNLITFDPFWTDLIQKNPKYTTKVLLIIDNFIVSLYDRTTVRRKNLNGLDSQSLPSELEFWSEGGIKNNFAVICKN